MDNLFQFLQYVAVFAVVGYAITFVAVLCLFVAVLKIILTDEGL